MQVLPAGTALLPGAHSSTDTSLIDAIQSRPTAIELPLGAWKITSAPSHITASNRHMRAGSCNPRRKRSGVDAATSRRAKSCDGSHIQHRELLDVGSGRSTGLRLRRL